MMDVKAETRIFACSGVLEHLQISIRIAKRRNGTTTDVLIDADGLAAFVVIEVQFRQTHNDRFPVPQFKLCLHTAADDLLWWNPIGGFRPRSHKLNTATRHDIVLKPVCAQVAEHFQHRLISHVNESLPGCGMFRSSDPVLYDLLELDRGHASMSRHEEFHDRMFATRGRSLQVAFQQRSERFLLLPFRMLRRQSFHAIKGKEELYGNRLFTPEGAIVIEHGDAFCNRNEVRRIFRGHSIDKRNDRFLCRPFVPRRQRVSSTSTCDGEYQRSEDHKGSKSAVFHRCNLSLVIY